MKINVTVLNDQSAVAEPTSNKRRGHIDEVGGASPPDITVVSQPDG